MYFNVSIEKLSFEKYLLFRCNNSFRKISQISANMSPAKSLVCEGEFCVHYSLGGVLNLQAFRVTKHLAKLRQFFQICKLPRFLPGMYKEGV